jgi:putative restriction endonuclease
MPLNQLEQDLLRERIFARVRDMATEFGGALTYKQLLEFEIDGQRIALVGQRGIINPTIFDATLTVTSAAEGPYNDHFDENGILRYAFEAGDPRAGSNRKLLVALETRTPIILFERPISNLYVPFVGAFITGANFEGKFVEIAADATIKAQVAAGMSDIEKRYVTAEVRRRVHQPLFRARVLNAYDRRCAICRLNHADLLDAAHISPDADEGGTASVPNGLSLCKIHHAAYDRNLLGIDPDYRVHIDGDLLVEIDGPMSQHGLKDMHGITITIPKPKAQHPDKDKLAARFELFLAS